jgi:cytochrome oxidase Cu insertion factor (SCO1/SenC/PrrC family)
MNSQALKAFTAATVMALTAAGCDSKKPDNPVKPAIPMCNGCVEEPPAPVVEPQTSPAKPEAAKPYLITLKNGQTVDLSGLTDHTGRKVDAAYLQEKFAGKRVVPYFGFADCTWFCPPSTKAVMTALDSFPDGSIQFVVIASRTDPNTKQPYTPERMAEWVKSFNEERRGVIALTGPTEKLSAIYQAMQVHNEAGVHVPTVALIDEKGIMLGGAPTVTAHKDAAGKAYLKPAPQLLIPAMQQHFGLNPKAPAADTPAPGGP